MGLANAAFAPEARRLGIDMPMTPKIIRVVGSMFVAAAFIVSSQFSQGPQPAEALYACDVWDMTFDAEEQAFLATINGYRAQYGLAPLSVSTNLNRSATWMANDLATSGRWSHTDSLGRTFDVRIRDCGGWSWSGENLASGQPVATAGAAFELWRTSASHNANMLNAAYRQIGIARVYNPSSPYGWYWATDFSTSHDGTDGFANATAAAAPASPVTFAAAARAAIASPLSGYVPASAMTLNLSPAYGAWEYWLEVGSGVGAADYFNASIGLSTAAQIGGLPAGATVYVRLWTLSSGGWVFQDYSYQTTI